MFLVVRNAMGSFRLFLGLQSQMRHPRGRQFVMIIFGGVLVVVKSIGRLSTGNGFSLHYGRLNAGFRMTFFYIMLI